jgi:dethiobiotin synthetase
MKSVFVTGTDTGVGKTLVTGLLAEFLSKRGLRIVTQKWIETGGGGDLQSHIDMSGIDCKEFLHYALPYTFSYPASPHLAASLEKRSVDEERIKSAFSWLKERFEVVIVEGIGGLLVPFTRDRLVIDVVEDIGLPVLVVAKNRLGAINHTLLTIEAIERRRLEILGVVFNGEKGGDRLILEDNPKIVEELTGVRVFTLPYSEEKGVLKREFLSIGEALYRAITGS